MEFRAVLLKFVGVCAGGTCLLAIIIPSAVILADLFRMFDVLVVAPSSSVRPLGLWYKGIWLTVVNLLYGIPLAIGCGQLSRGCKSVAGENISVWSAGLCIGPVVLAVGGSAVVVFLTNSSFGE